MPELRSGRIGEGANERPWSATVRLDEVPETGHHVTLEADAATRASLAKVAGVDAVEHLAAMFDITREGPGLHVVGAVNGTVRQTCVVTLDPVVNAIDEAVDLVFRPEQGAATPADRKHSDTDNQPEALVDGAVDLGAVATEFLVLGVDPYPRKPGVSFAPTAAGEAAARPFAALEALKKGGKVKG